MAATLKYRRYLVERETSKNQKETKEIERAKENCIGDIHDFDCSPDLIKPIFDELEVILRNADNAFKSKILKKINSLYHGYHVKVRDKYFCLKDSKDSYINMSSYNLSSDERDFLNLGLNCHFEPKYDKMHKKVELEVLYQNLLELEAQNKITVSEGLADRMKAESTKHRNVKNQSLITPSIRAAAKSLKNNKDIVIRKADKSATYVLLDREEYISKLNSILADETKFRKISRNPTEKLKQRTNRLIETLNAAQDSLKLSKIIGDYKPGYVYGNVKIHKQGNPLRPIISQIPTPTYNLAKRINKIIAPYMPDQYSLKSSNDFVDLLDDNVNDGVIASLDVQSLFTNVPIDSTIEIILQYTYSHPNIPPPKIPKEILKQFLQICTKEAPFTCPQGKLYLQVEGVAMGSPLGPTFANFYMGHLENQIFKNPNLKPNIYARYVDDIFIQITDENQLINLKNLFEENSVLKFTYELNVNSKLPFLDVLVDSSNTRFRTQVYHKPTDQGNCLNGNSECCERYKTSVITNYINRAYRLSDTWDDFHLELSHIKQKLVNNNYSNAIVDKYIKKFLDLKQSQVPKKSDKEIIPIYYENQYHANYKKEERVIKDLVYSNIKSTDEKTKLDLRIYYKNPKTCNLVMKNNISPPARVLDETNVIYKFSCPMSHRQATEYIGFTQTTLSQRLVSHRQNGSIHNHFKEFHNMKPTCNHLVENTKTIAKAKDRSRLAIKEALIILQEKPIINKQYDNFSNILKLHNPRNIYKEADTEKTENKVKEHPHIASTSVEDPIFISSPANMQLSQRTHRLLTSPIKLNLVHGNLLTPHSKLPNLNVTSSHGQTTSTSCTPLKSIDHPKLNNSCCSLDRTVNITETSDKHLTSLSLHNFDEVASCTDDSSLAIPDMEKVLMTFGISPYDLVEVDIENCSWLDFHQSTELPHKSPSISQRIHTLVRKCRKNISTNRTPTAN